jgi:deoxyadenosine/deoxycytidine kinase
VHKRRLETRNRQIEGFVYDARWEDLEGSYQEWYVPFPDPALVLDAVAPLDENIQTAVAYVESLIRLR